MLNMYMKPYESMNQVRNLIKKGTQNLRICLVDDNQQEKKFFCRLSYRSHTYVRKVLKYPITKWFNYVNF